MLGGFALWLTAPRSRSAAAARARTLGRGEGAPAHDVLARYGRHLASVGLLGLSVTGMTWSVHAGESIGRVQSALAGPPRPCPRPCPGTPPGRIPAADPCRRRTSVTWVSTRWWPRHGRPD
ncbi:hypothetical protein [Streptomyces sp. RKAG290]|uniref:hypothetical protein n=1 Tax=Streptomyces sp. RKAG290 TaxID=2888348 RepID=UPI0035A88A3B